MSERFKKLAAFFAAFVRKYWGIIAGAGIYRVFSWIFDNPLWMSVELKWHEQGVIAMMIAAFFINTMLLAYFRNKSTRFILWSALDELSGKEFEFHEAYAKWGQKKNPWKIYLVAVSYVPVKLAIFMLWCLKKSPRLGDLAAFLILPIIEDPFITTMYLRHGHGNGLRAKDYIVYLASNVISIGYWAIRNAVIVEIAIRPIFS